MIDIVNKFTCFFRNYYTWNMYSYYYDEHLVMEDAEECFCSKVFAVLMFSSFYKQNNKNNPIYKFILNLLIKLSYIKWINKSISN